MTKKLLFFFALMVSFSFGKAQSIVSQNVLPEQYIFFHGDTLEGFDVNKAFQELAEFHARVNLTDFEKRLFMSRKQGAFVRTKYHLPEPAVFQKKATLQDEHKRFTTNNSSSFKILPPSHSTAVGCLNFDFEYGDTSYWTGLMGYNGGSGTVFTYPGGMYGEVNNAGLSSCTGFSLVNGGTDHYSGLARNNPNGGSWTMRMGGDNINLGYDSFGNPFGAPDCGFGDYSGAGESAAEYMFQYINVTAANCLITYYYNVILQGAPHSSGNQPYFNASIFDNTSTILTCSDYYQEATPLTGVPPTGYLTSGFLCPSDNTVPVSYSGWQANTFDLSAQIGTTVKLRFKVAGCTGGQHMAYAYVDATCGPKQLSISPASVCLGSGTKTVSAPPCPPGTTFSWSTGATTSSISVAVNGTYSVTITPPAPHTNCPFTISSTVTFNPVPTVTVTSSADITCHNLNNGTATVSASGGSGFTYTWSPAPGGGQGTTTATGLGAGTYTCTVNNSGSCTGSNTTTIANPTALGSSIASQTNVTCNGSATGSATVSASNGTPGYSYTWSPVPGGGQGTPSATGLSNGSYNCTIHDANGCPIVQAVSISQPTALSASVSAQTNVSCNGGNNASATVTPSGGTAGYGYVWSPAPGAGQGTATATGLSNGAYNCTITDANSCTYVKAVTITQPVSPLSASVSAQTNVSCNGGNNASATVAPVGGTAGYAYVWSPAPGGGQGTPTASGLSNGAYNCTITDTKSCTYVQAVTITQPVSALSASVSSQTNVSCNGGNNASATVAPTGGTAGYAYAWSPAPGGGQGTPTATGLSNGAYNCTITDAKSCTYVQAITITQPATSLTVSSNSQTATGCGTATGTATVGVSGGTGVDTYTWAPAPGGGQGSVTATGLSAGNYTVTVHDNNGCPITQVYTIAPAGGPGATLTSSTNAKCNGACNGTATVTGTGGTGAGTYTYTWTGGAGSASTASGLCAGTYTCTVTDGNNCPVTKTVTITAPAVLAASVGSQTNASCNGSSTGSATVSVSGGTSAYTYVWSGGTITTGQGTATASGLAIGTYTCSVTDANSCTSSQQFTISQPSAVTITPSSTQTGCGVATGTATATAGGGTPGYTYTWSPAPGAGQSTSTASVLGTGSYTVTVNDSKNCSQQSVYNITSAGAPSASILSSANPGCNAACTGNATVKATGGTGAYTYSWTSGAGTAATANNLCAGTYSCTITDANNCSVVQTAVIGQPAALAVTPTQTNASCNASATGSATATVTGGTGTYTYAWTPSGGNAATASGLAAGTYTCTVNDANNCSTSKVYTITQPALLSIAPSQVNVDCNGNSSGTASVAASGGTSAYTYSWTGGTITGGQGTVSASGLASGTYTCTVTDAQNCLATQNFTISQPAALVLTPSSTQTGCGIATGTASVTAAGGTASYTYSWTPAPGTGQNSANAGALASGNYTVTVTDAHSCVKSSVFNITASGAPSATLQSSSNALCKAACNGTATVSITGGTGSMTYSWTGGAGNAASASSLCAGTYTCTITDASNCSTTQSVVITEPTTLAIASSQTNVACNAGTSGSATATVSGGTTNYTYSWSPSGGNGSTASSLAAGTYTCTVNDANNCSTAQIYTITEPAALSIAASQKNLSCNGNNSGTATALVSGGTSSYTYAWTPSGGNAATATGLASGSYTCTVTDANGCSNTQAYTITQPVTLTTTASPVPATCNLNNGSATATPAGGSGSYSYAWTPSGGNAATANGLTAGTYTCVVTDSLGCNTSVTVSVANTGSKPVASVNPTGATSFCQGSSEVIAASGGGTYSWSNGSTGNFISVTAPGDYTVYVSNSCGIDSAKVHVTMNPLPVPVITGNTSFCKGDSALLVASGGSSYSWSNGFTGSTQYVYTSGVYTVTATNTCGSTSTSATVTVNSVTANFGASVDSGYYPLPVIFTDSSSSTANTWSWTFGDGSGSSNQNTNNTYTTGGIYTVTLTVTSAAGCTSTLQKIIVVRDTPSWIIVPNIFTPNGDGVNDILQISSAGIVEFDLVFFDRWGVALAELKVPGAGWDGRTDGGVMVSNGTYYYILRAKGDDGRVFNLTGFVELIH